MQASNESLDDVEDKFDIGGGRELGRSDVERHVVGLDDTASILARSFVRPELRSVVAGQDRSLQRTAVLLQLILSAIYELDKRPRFTVVK